MSADSTSKTGSKPDQRDTSSVLMRSMLRSVVKVFTTSDAPDYEQPWQTDGPDASVGSGAIVMTRRGPRILTNAHVVENQVSAMFATWRY